jgi:GT2 family glycosyltransferase
MIGDNIRMEEDSRIHMHKPSICAVIVLYRERAENSRTAMTMQMALATDPSLASRLLLCLYDNSPAPEPVSRDIFPAETLIFQTGVNGGLPSAYNKALEIAEARGISWLLLLDSDTGITAEFLNACLRAIRETDGSPQIAAIVPHVLEGGIAHSPRKMEWLRRPALSPEACGALTGELIALNSGTAVRVSAVEALGGFSSEFWLDYLDYWLFRALQRKGLHLFVLRETVEHSLSLADAGTRMSVERYRNMLDAEHYFVASYGSAWERVRLKLVLLYRAARFAREPLNRRFFPLAVKNVFRWQLGEPPQPPHS